MQFEIRALGTSGQMQTVRLEAEDAAAAHRAAQAQRLTPVTVKALGQGRARRRGRGAFSLVMFSQELLALLEAGLSLVEGLEALIEKESNESSRAIMAALITRMREGLRFSDAVAQQPEHFPPLFIGIVKAAERTSDLPQALARYVDYQTRVEQVRSRIVSALIYPCVLFSVGGMVALFLMAYVVPKFASVYKDSGRDLPWMSKLLLGWGDFLSAHAMPVGIVVASIIALIMYTLRRITREGRWSQLAARVPGIAERARILELSRMYLTLGMLLEGGITILTALDMVSGTVAPDSRAKLVAARGEIANGEPVSRAFELHGLSTPIALRMLRVGERSGQLGAMLTRSALFYEGESARWIERFSKVFEPALMAFIGIVIGLIVVLLYMPIFDLAGSLQ
ncbi:MAG: type II secretion system F family protein [Rhodocyclaceae bacterium]